jgi:hypothetical protein
MLIGPLNRFMAGSIPWVTQTGDRLAGKNQAVVDDGTL